VLHDLFAVPFDEVAAILDKSPAAVRQLASRARRRVQGRSPDGTPDPLRQREIVEAFLAASRGGDFDGLLSLLDPDAICRADAAAAAMGSPAVAVAGAHNVAEFFAGRAKAARPALLGGDAGLVWMHRGEVKVAFDFTIRDGVIVAIDLIADPGHLADLDIETLPVGAGL
jgi:RNA polymerase sigma-70 factor (ECF subfamily)